MAWISEVSADNEPSKEQIEAHKLTYHYDAEDKVTAIHYALPEDNRVESLHFAYDGNRWLTSVKAKVNGTEEKKTVRSYEYDKLGKVSVVKEYPDFADGGKTCIVKSYQYNELDQVTSMMYKKEDTVLEAYTYAYDKNGNIVQKRETNQTAQNENDRTDITKDYTYNALGQLVKTELTDHKDKEKKATITYTYDKAGNRIKQTEGGSETVYTYNGLDQLKTAVTELGEVTRNHRSYEYDMNGNQIKESDSKTGITVTHEYDTENRLSKATITAPTGTDSETPEGEAAMKSLTQENLYNGNGQRIQKKEGSDVTNYFYQDGVVSYTTGEDTEVKQIQNLLGLEENVIGAETSTTNQEQAKVISYFLYNKDIQGSTTSILNHAGTGELSYEYDDFGQTEIHGSSDLENEICYTGGIYDESTGLYYLNARYYDPENGRFLTEDTYRGELNDPDTLHLYVYCKNNPINYVDPSGHKFFSLSLINKIFVGSLWYLNKWVRKIPSKKEHYERNKYNTKLPKTKSAAKDKKYKKLSAANSACHQFSAPKGKPNLKYVSKDGKKEVVYKYDGKKIVTDPRDIGTYNFGPGTGMNHLFKDLIPYLWWGNNKKDSTTLKQRCTKSAMGMLKGKYKESYNKVSKIAKKKGLIK